MRNFNLKNKDSVDTKITFAVGPETKEALVNLGYKNLVNTNGNLDNLKMKIVKYLKPNSRILHPTYLSKTGNLKIFFIILIVTIYVYNAIVRKRLMKKKTYLKNL